MNWKSLVQIRSIGWIVSAIALVHVVAFFVNDTLFEAIFLLSLSCAVLFLGVLSLEYAIGVAFVELFVGGHGHLLAANVGGFPLSLRMSFFLAVFGAFAFHVLRTKRGVAFVFWRDIGWILLGVGVLFAGVIGFLSNQRGLAFDDANGYIFALYLLPILFVQWTKASLQKFGQLFVGSIVWLGGFTLLLSYLFTHLNGKQTHVLYTFVRDSRLAEVTLQAVSNSSQEVQSGFAAALLGVDGYWYRIFMQSQIFLIVGLVICITFALFKYRDKWLPGSFVWLASLFAAGSILSFSRSFLLGLVASLPVIFVSMFAVPGKRVQTFFSRSVLFACIAFLGVFSVFLSIALPVPPRADIQDAAFYKTASDSGRNLAVSSRWQLLNPMLQEIKKNPVIGSGFGKEVTFISDDPRVRAQNPSGEWTTYRFEWGFLDLWLKMGLLGLLGYSFIFVAFFLVAFYSKRSWFAWAAFASIVFLFATHFFTPYLNHPLGIGLILFFVPFLDWESIPTPRRMLKKAS